MVWPGSVDTCRGLIIPAAFSAFGTFLLRQFTLSIPPSLDEAAKVDGASHRPLVMLSSEDLGEHRCMGPASRWAEAFSVMWSKLVEDIRQCAVYDDDEARAVTGALDPYLKLFDRDVPSSLLHMDIWAQDVGIASARSEGSPFRAVCVLSRPIRAG